MGSKTKLMMRAGIRLDLKDSGSLWSDDELNRSIERSVADFNRFIPDEKIYEDSLQFAVTGESVAFPADTSTDGIVADEDLSTASAGDTLTDVEIDGQPDVPRPLTLTLTDANNSVQGMTIIINGTDKDDQALQEVFHYTIGDSKTIHGLKYFKAVYLIEIDQIAGNGADDLLDIGYGAYTDVWISLANSPIRRGTESATNDNDSDAAVARNTDFYMDYANGRVKAIAATTPGIDAEDVCTFAYTKSQIGIDLSDLPGLIRVQRVEYPIGEVPQSFVQFDTFGKYVIVTGSGESEEQQRMSEDKQFRVYYDAVHQSPGEYSPGTMPDFLENTVETLAAAYALYIYVLKHEHQAGTDMDSARTAVTAANTAHTALGTALTNIRKYLDNNSDADAAGILQDITDEVANLRTAITTALDAANVYLDEVDTTDLAGAEGVWADYGDTYVIGATAPSIKKYLEDGDAFLNTLAVGGEGQEVPNAYRQYAESVSAIISAFEQKRTDFLQEATARTNAAMGYTQEAAQRLSTVRSYVEQSSGYAGIASLFAREAEARLTEINAYLAQASGYTESAGDELIIADRFKADADSRRGEVWGIWLDRKQYIGDFTQSSMKQMPSY